MKTLIAIVLVAAALVPLVVTPALAQTGNSHEEQFDSGNRLYESGDYDGAIEAWADLVDRGAVDPALLYNLGNAYYKIGSVGRAVLYYERAQRLAPRDPDIAENLALTRLIIRDREFLQGEGWARRALLWVPRNLSTRELAVLASMFYLLLTVVVIGFVFRNTAVVSRLYGRISVLSPGRLFGLRKSTDFLMAGVVVLALFVTTGTAAWSKYRAESERLEAVVLQEEVPVYGGPTTQAILQFKIHEGTLARVADVRPGWVEIELPGELSGWVRSDALERI